MFKTLSLLSLFFMISFYAAGQEKLSEAEIVGTWNITAIDMGEGLYMDLQNDSIHVADSLKKNWKTKEDSTIALGMLKMLSEPMKQFVITIYPKGTFEAHMGPKGDTGSYVITDNKVELKLKSKSDVLVGTRENELMKFDSGKGKKRLVMYFHRQ